MIKFEWDTKKASANKKKHGVSFLEAESVFADPHARLIQDPDHSEDEERFVLLGMSAELRILVVCHCFKESVEVIRIISVRKANKSERNEYGRQL